MGDRGATHEPDIRSSPTTAAAVGVLTPFVLGLSIKLADDRTRATVYEPSNRPIWYGAVAGVLGLVCLIAGSWHYLRRYSP